MRKNTILFKHVLIGLFTVCFSHTACSMDNPPNDEHKVNKRQASKRAHPTPTPAVGALADIPALKEMGLK